MWSLTCIVALAVAATAHAHTDGFIDQIGNAQRELYVGHGFFQEQYYRLPSSFGVYLGEFNKDMLHAIGTSVDRFNRNVDDINDDLDGMNVTDECLNLWETLQLRYGRSLATCAEYGYDEIQYMVQYYDFVIWWSQYYITNQVQTHAMNQFVYWNPLMYPGFNVIGGINNELRFTLDNYYDDYIGYIEYARDYNLARMDGIIASVATCANTYVVSFQQTSAMFMQDVAANRC